MINKKNKKKEELLISAIICLVLFFLIWFFGLRTGVVDLEDFKSLMLFSLIIIVFYYVLGVFNFFLLKIRFLDETEILFKAFYFTKNYLIFILITFYQILFLIDLAN
ncbi:hypothetical protein [Marinigracilibium pacificum]|uniref:Uncharacterized protein n=1 Tax=Marinigracilibium pacificum TaxID=2729599 RepID=A0A848IWQ2_9BACT|nr:hypothetical protein [Marinigracilibium pacificum]NMM48096.1 hypothetical protein [Marinigracilibium pacificum]